MMGFGLCLGFMCAADMHGNLTGLGQWLLLQLKTLVNSAPAVCS
jgi:hypothetical protein